MSALEAYYAIDEKLQRLLNQSYRSICENLPMDIAFGTDDQVQVQARRDEVWEEMMYENGIKFTTWINPVDRAGFCLVFDPRQVRILPTGLVCRWPVGLNDSKGNFLMIPKELALKIRVLECLPTK